MDTHGGDLRLPDECAQWCRKQDYHLVVEDDVAPIDLDWWTQRLSTHAIPARLWGYDADGARVGAGAAFLRRRDLDEAGLSPLEVLYRCAAWLAGHRRLV